MRYILLSLVLALSACANTMDKMSGIGQISESTDTFNDARVITLSESWNNRTNDSDFASTMFGARWSSSTPESIVIYLKFNSMAGAGSSYVIFDGIRVNIDGEVRSFDAVGNTSFDSTSTSSSIYTSSRSAVVVPLDYLKKMLSEEDVRIRVLMNDSYDDILFNWDVSGYGQVTAKGRLKELVERI
ncbi:MAG: hypothetical protein ABNH21_06755 [Glaciecola sp.]